MSDLETFGPKLTEAGNRNPYKVPEGYFDGLPSRVQELCKKQEAEEVKTSWAVTLRTQLALAAGICLFVLLALTGFYYSKQVGLNSPFRKDYIKIVEESGTEFEEFQLYEVVTNGVKKDSIKNQRNDELMDYLLNDYIENGTLLEPTRTIKP